MVAIGNGGGKKICQQQFLLSSLLFTFFPLSNSVGVLDNEIALGIQILVIVLFSHLIFFNMYIFFWETATVSQWALIRDWLYTPT